ncbi:hypothetical protein Patl1_34286 [Pistacia atlantica]|uniref:Uncharacterized protein n=1 Tax=Pistacia atlantica TaxID=434234 RepID=A0ACC0ZUS7_9ROSI|nr:hypothetical protein Patl1_34286 [Pistacia atlantica]
MPVPVPTYSRAPSTSNSLGSDKSFPPHSPGIRRGMFLIKFTYEELKMATDKFSSANFLGEGGFGYVHKGVIPNNNIAGEGRPAMDWPTRVKIALGSARGLAYLQCSCSASSTCSHGLSTG